MTTTVAMALPDDEDWERLLDRVKAKPEHEVVNYVEQLGPRRVARELMILAAHLGWAVESGWQCNVRGAWREILMHIYHRRLMPELAAMNYGLRELQQMASYPAQTQLQLADPEMTWAVIDPSAEDVNDHRILPVRSLDSWQRKQIFGEKGLRDVHEQLRLLQSPGSPQAFSQIVVRAPGKLIFQIEREARRQRLTSGEFIVQHLRDHGVVE